MFVEGLHVEDFDREMYGSSNTRKQKMSGLSNISCSLSYPITYTSSFPTPHYYYFRIQVSMVVSEVGNNMEITPAPPCPRIHLKLPVE